MKLWGFVVIKGGKNLKSALSIKKTAKKASY